MIRYILNKTDDFICNRIKDVFEKTETRFKNEQMPLSIEKELKKFEEEPLGCIIGKRDRFEIAVKIKIKLIIGFFFVLVPLVVFGLVSWWSDINITFAVYGTLLIALLVSSRMEELAKRYVRNRSLASA